MNSIKSILFVCTANSGRSPMAEYYCKSIAAKKGINLEIGSAGTDFYPVEISEYSLALLQQDGIDATMHQPRVLTKELVKKYDLILCMENSHINKIIEKFPESKAKLFLLSEFAAGLKENINDPIGMGLEEYRKVYNRIKYFIDLLIMKLEM